MMDLSQRNLCLVKTLNFEGALVKQTADGSKTVLKPDFLIFTVISPSNPGPISQPFIESVTSARKAPKAPEIIL